MRLMEAIGVTGAHRLGGLLSRWCQVFAGMGLCERTAGLGSLSPTSHPPWGAWDAEAG